MSTVSSISAKSKIFFIDKFSIFFRRRVKRLFTILIINSILYTINVTINKILLISFFYLIRKVFFINSTVLKRRI